MTYANFPVGLEPLQIPPDSVAALSILVVEDNVLIARFLAEILLELGHTVCANARTESEAVQAAARYAPDMIIADVHLASGDGVAAVRKIERAGHVPHLYMTGGGVSTIPEYAAVLRKPFSLDDLVRGLANALDPMRIAASALARSVT